MHAIPVGILGATGTVGQRFIELLEGHPWFTITDLAASDRSAGKPYAEAVGDRWKMNVPIPERVAQLPVSQCVPELRSRVVFSALDSDVAGPIEEEFAAAGCTVFSNSRNHRMDPDVPLLVPEVNGDHLQLLEAQRARFAQGCIITNPNCSTIGLTMALAPLHARFGLTKVMVTTMQALSGAGYPGVASMDILDNVIPYISGEEPKMESEPLKILGSLRGDTIEPAQIIISAACNRVAVTDGHLECVSVACATPPPDETAIIDAWRRFNPLGELGLPFAPPAPIIYTDNPQRPQPRVDRDCGNGMACTVGRLRPCPILDFKFIVLSHNTIRGAAGASILNAELARTRGLI